MGNKKTEKSKRTKKRAHRRKAKAIGAMYGYPPCVVRKRCKNIWYELRVGLGRHPKSSMVLGVLQQSLRRHRSSRQTAIEFVAAVKAAQRRLTES